METLILVFALISSVLSAIVSLLYAYIAYKKSKEPPKDEIWETVTKIICNSDSMKYADDFAFLYEELKFFKGRGCTMDGINALSYEVRHKHKPTPEAEQ